MVSGFPHYDIIKDVTSIILLILQNPRDGYFTMGDHTCRVPMALFAENRKRLAATLRETPDLPENAMVLLQVYLRPHVLAVFYLQKVLFLNIEMLLFRQEESKVSALVTQAMSGQSSGKSPSSTGHLGSSNRTTMVQWTSKLASPSSS